MTGCSAITIIAYSYATANGLACSVGFLRGKQRQRRNLSLQKEIFYRQVRGPVQNMMLQWIARVKLLRDIYGVTSGACTSPSPPPPPPPFLNLYMYVRKLHLQVAPPPPPPPPSSPTLYSGSGTSLSSHLDKTVLQHIGLHLTVFCS